VVVSGEGKRRRHWHIVVKRPTSTIIKCPKEYMGIVIGRGGQTIKNLREKWGPLRVIEIEIV
jgi:predicted PilT family ATPase